MTRIWNRVVSRLGSDRGQATVEYFLVILAATALARRIDPVLPQQRLQHLPRPLRPHRVHTGGGSGVW